MSRTLSSRRRRTTGGMHSRPAIHSKPWSTSTKSRANQQAPRAPPRAQEPFSRIKKELLKEAKALGPGERVLLLGSSREPYLCAKKDEKAFLGFWAKHVFTPLPDYASRRIVWPGLFERHQVRRRGRGL